MTEKGIEIYKSKTGEIVFDVDPEHETIWATQAQIAQIFDVDRSRITHHLGSIFADKELDEKSVCAFSAHTAADGKTYRVKTYNLDAIISVGYRVNSKKATDFRIWATKILHGYLTTGIVVNKTRLESADSKRLKEVESVMGMVKRLLDHQALNEGEANGILEVISKYSTSFEMLKQYDNGFIDLSGLNKDKKKQKPLTAPLCKKMIENLRDSIKGGELFGNPTSGSLEDTIDSICQNGEESSTIAENAAALLYFVVKNRPFRDGNKRIGALLFIMFLTINDYHLTNQGETKISDRALTAIVLLIAESDPKERPLISSLIVKLLEK